MLKIALGFFIAAIAAAVFGFGGWAGALTSLAILAFYVFVALFALTLLLGLISGLGHSPAGAGAMLVTALLVGAGVYWWADNGMTAQKLGAKLDRSAIGLRHDAGDAFQTASSETSRFVGRVGDEAKETSDRVEDRVDGDR